MADRRPDDAGPRDDTIVLPERMDLATAGRLRAAILAAAGDVVLDAAGVDIMTSPGIQVLMAARNRQRERGRSLRLAAPSAGFSACAATLGVPLARLETTGDA